MSTKAKKRPHAIDQSGEQSKTQQQFAAECDINTILRKFHENGIQPHLQSSQAEYGFAPNESFFESMLLVKQGEETFRNMPAKIRAHFENDPGLFLDATQDETRRQEFVDLGLLEQPPSHPDDPRFSASEDPVSQPDTSVAESPPGDS